MIPPVDKHTKIQAACSLFSFYHIFSKSLGFKSLGNSIHNKGLVKSATHKGVADFMINNPLTNPVSNWRTLNAIFKRLTFTKGEIADLYIEKKGPISPKLIILNLSEKRDAMGFHEIDLANIFTDSSIAIEKVFLLPEQGDPLFSVVNDPSFVRKNKNLDLLIIFEPNRTNRVISPRDMKAGNEMYWVDKGILGSLSVKYFTYIQTKRLEFLQKAPIDPGLRRIASAYIRRIMELEPDPNIANLQIQDYLYTLFPENSYLADRMSLYVFKDKINMIPSMALEQDNFVQKLVPRMPDDLFHNPTSTQLCITNAAKIYNSDVASIKESLELLWLYELLNFPVGSGL